MKKEIAEKEFSELAQAVGTYIKAMGGTALVVGGISLEHDAKSLKNNFVLRIHFTGKAPTKKFV